LQKNIQNAEAIINRQLQFDSIILQRGKDDYPSYTYADTSTLHQLVNVLKDKGYRFEKITELNK